MTEEVREIRDALNQSLFNSLRAGCHESRQLLIANLFELCKAIEVNHLLKVETRKGPGNTWSRASFTHGLEDDLASVGLVAAIEKLDNLATSDDVIKNVTSYLATVISRAMTRYEFTGLYGPKASTKLKAWRKERKEIDELTQEHAAGKVDDYEFELRLAKLQHKKRLRKTSISQQDCDNLDDFIAAIDEASEYIHQDFSQIEDAIDFGVHPTDICIYDELRQCCNDERDERILQLREQGIRDREIGIAIGISQQGVNSRRAGIRMRLCDRLPDSVLYRYRDFLGEVRIDSRHGLPKPHFLRNSQEKKRRNTNDVSG